MKAAIASIVKAGGLFTCSLLLLLGGCSGGSSTNSTLPIAPAPSPVGAQTPKPGSSPTDVPSVKPSAIPNPVVSPTPTPAPTPIGFNDYVTFGYDNQRDSFNPNSTAITSASVAAMHLVRQSALSGDFDTQSQPILATEIPGHAAALRRRRFRENLRFRCVDWDVDLDDDHRPGTLRLPRQHRRVEQVVLVRHRRHPRVRCRLEVALCCRELQYRNHRVCKQHLISHRRGQRDGHRSGELRPGASQCRRV